MHTQTTLVQKYTPREYCAGYEAMTHIYRVCDKIRLSKAKLKKSNKTKAFKLKVSSSVSSLDGVSSLLQVCRMNFGRGCTILSNAVRHGEMW